MARPIMCLGGYAVPLKKGKFEIVGYSVAPNAIGTQMDIGLVDDKTIGDNDSFGKIITSEADCLAKNQVIHFAKAIASGGSYDFMFPEPIKIIHGLSIYSTNVLAGTFCVYMR